MAGLAVIVGYGSGVGASVARVFGREGMAVALLARDGAKVTAAATAMEQAGQAPQAAGFAADAGDPASLNAALDAAVARFGRADVLVYNAAAWRDGPVLALAPEQLVEDFQVCTVGALVAARAVAPAMRARGQGTIIFTGGGFALFPSAMAPSLSIGKAGIRSLALMLAAELAPAGVRVGTVTIMGVVAPGTKFDPDAIARRYLDIHRGAAGATVAELQFI